MAWATEAVPKFVENHFVSLVADERQAREALEGLFALPYASDAASLLLRGLAAHLENLDAVQLFGIADALASLLENQEVQAILSWSIERLEAGTTPLWSIPTGDRESTLASFLFAFFGNVDKRKRWRAAHAARAIIGSEDQVLVDRLAELSSANAGGAFVDHTQVFYWLSARHWLLLLLARVAEEHPKLLRRHVDQLADVATSIALPHAAIRHAAKRAAISVASFDATALDSERRASLELVNEPVSCWRDRKYRREPDERRRNRRAARFHFDGMDTLPYWYSPLARLFGLKVEEVEGRAESWILDRLGYNRSDVWNDRRELSREHDSGLLSNRQGNVPYWSL